MNKKALLELIAKKEARKQELLGKVEGSNNVEELRSINTELQTLNAEITELRSIADSLPDDPTPAPNPNPANDPIVRSALGASAPTGQQTPQGPLSNVAAATYGLGINQRNIEKEEFEKAEQRGADLKAKKPVIFLPQELRGLFPSMEQRAVTIASQSVVTEQKYSNILQPWFKQVSGLVDLVNVIPLQGGVGYTQGFEIQSGEAQYTAEGAVYTESDPQFGYVSIGMAKLASYTEITDEMLKLPNVDYQNYVAQQMITSIKKQLGAQILLGAGGTNQLTGIFSAPANVMPTADCDITTITAIDENTLDTLVMTYGGDEAVEGGQWLILNKADLAAFAAVRATTGQKLYNITLNGQTGTISSDRSYSVNFVINSGAPALSSANTPSGTYTMAYGSPSVYELPVFSPIEVMESRDFKFSSGQLAYRASMYAGGNVTKYKGFLRVKKP
ncbi:phage major capsid protein [Alicyclobacillus sp. ALC3]|uniref:phage major capsid protein n=1 Tax=Alicyclobacillus sp. ALC3 TaxID=2796143 RepID=UPI0023780E5B|nr:phage major capsid protein [Alicyclobacillus sp. ALC3]WDL98132.1 phage major capsid protein [Alicyclobacillus sp. ALC3]